MLLTGRQDVDFLITAALAPKSIKEHLLRTSVDYIEDGAGVFYYKHRCGEFTAIDFVPTQQVVLAVTLGLRLVQYTDEW
jgi:hypothetical protein